VNDITAKANEFFLIIAIFLSTIVSIVLFFALGLLGTLTFAVPFLIWKQGAKDIHAFNGYLLTR